MTEWERLMDRFAVASALREMGRLLEARGDSPFRVRAYERGARAVEGVADLGALVEQDRLREVPGIGPVLAAAVAELHRTGRSERMERQRGLLRHLRAGPGVTRADAAGALRRCEETVSELQLLAAAADPASVVDHFAAFPLLATVLSRNLDHCAARLPDGLRVELAVTPIAAYEPALHRLTGSRAHLEKLGAVARGRGLALDEAGLHRAGSERPLPVKTEADLYRRLGLPWLPPEVREDEGEVEAAAEGDTFADLLTEGDIKGLVHCHTVYSDGKHTVEQMARAAEAMGM